MKNKKEIICRAFALFLVARRAKERLDDKLTRKNTHKKIGKELCKWLNKNHLDGIFTKEEKKIIYSSMAKKEWLLWFAFGSNAVEMLLWAVTLSDLTWPIYVDVEKNDIFGIDDGVSHLQELEEKGKLRDKREIEKMCNIAMLWQWRAIEGCLSLFDTEEIQQLIARVFGDDELTELMGEIPKGKDGHDFWIECPPSSMGQEEPIQGIHFNSLKRSEMQWIQCITEWKQKALEWVLCDEEWDDVSADT